jgi:hypothetical protein
MMSKRFSDTDKWKDVWFRKLDAKYKLFWFYILDNCDHAGIWKVDVELAGLFCGFTYDEKELTQIFAGRIQVLALEKWFVSKFVQFQYAVQSLDELNVSNKVHASVIKILQSNNLITKDMSVYCKSSPMQGAKDKDKDKDTYKDKYMDKDKDKDKDKEKEKDKDKETVSPYLDTPPSLKEVSEYFQERVEEYELETDCFLARCAQDNWNRKSGAPITDWM